MSIAESKKKLLTKQGGRVVRALYPDASRCACHIDGRDCTAENVTVRSFNFGQHWRTESVPSLDYRVELPMSFVADLLRVHLPDYIEDSRAHFDPESEIDRALEAAGWPDVDEIIGTPELLRRFVAFYDTDLLGRWFGSGEPEHPGAVLNTIARIDLALDDGVVRFEGTGRPSGLAVRYQDV